MVHGGSQGDGTRGSDPRAVSVGVAAPADAEPTARQPGWTRGRRAGLSAAQAWTAPDPLQPIVRPRRRQAGGGVPPLPEPDHRSARSPSGR